MAFKVVYTAPAERDIELILDFLVESHVEFGDTPELAIERAGTRVQAICDDGDSIGRAPFRGTLDDKLLAGLRHVTINRAIFYFDVHEAKEEVSILAVFFGGQDHRQQMLRRLLG